MIELIQGARSAREVRSIRSSLLALRFRILPLSEPVGSTAAALIELHALAQGLQLGDALIAATALEAGEPVCTANTRHCRPVRALTLVEFRPE